MIHTKHQPSYIRPGTSCSRGTKSNGKHNSKYEFHASVLNSNINSISFCVWKLPASPLGISTVYGITTYVGYRN